MGLTGIGLKVTLIALATAIPLLGGWWWSGGRFGRAAALVAICAAAQVLALGAAFVVVNDRYQFYSDFNDLLGRNGAVAPIQVNVGAEADGGRITKITIQGQASQTTAQALVWLPPQYDQPAYRNFHFPVVEFLPGQPNYPGGVFARFHLGEVAAQAIHQGVHPFVLVVPPIMVRPPKDTECTNMRHGTAALSWLTKDVPTAVHTQLRVDPPGRHWSMIGWSTGGFCAAKVLLTEPGMFSAGVGLGAYYQPITEGAVPLLFGGSARSHQLNSPQWLYTHRGGLHDDRLLMISGKQDGGSWGSTKSMLRTTQGDPNVQYVAFPSGGHNVRDYAAYLPSIFTWLAKGKAMG